MITHRSPISGISAHNNRYVATAGYDNVLILWDAETKRSIARGCHDHLVNQCVFNGDGKYLASTSSDYTTRVWKIPSMQIQSILTGHTDDTEGISFHPTKELIATSSRDATIKIFNYNGQLIKNLKGHELDVNSVEWMKNKDVLISSSDDGTVKFWDYESGEVIRDLSFDEVDTDTIAVSGDGTIFAGNYEGEIVIISEEREPINVNAHKAGIKSLEYSEKQQKLISCSYDRSFKIWNYKDGMLHLEANHQFDNMVWPRSCAFLNDSEVVFGTFGNKYAQFNLKTKQWADNNIECTYGYNAVWESNGDIYTIGDAGYTFKNGHKIAEVGSLCNFIIDFKGNIITGGQTGEIFNAETGEVYYQHSNPLNCAVNFKSNGEDALAIGTYNGEAVVLTIDKNGSVQYENTYKFHENAIKGIAASEESIFTVCAAGVAAYHDVNTFKSQKVITDGHDKIANGAVAIGNGNFASTGRDLKLRIWEDGKVKVVDTSHKNSIKCISSDSESLIALGDYVGFVSVYDMKKDAFVAHMRVSDFGISSMTYDTTRKLFIASCYDGKAYDIELSK
ncbi:outer membrane protein assembly factor BamB [Kordia sp. SMS9]|uniref:WD40 repeat domain-containing protein n=1 Tax=Kordia sp. SMS9 TaxID=2282170 RepID=UPI000E0D0667|nr:WD40 repeat domain-containing protein [Kordia sp. SMS9]AXG70221.1 outer membrane protein assembly factor BamB [Kordia sp. SMS9]